MNIRRQWFSFTVVLLFSISTIQALATSADAEPSVPDNHRFVKKAIKHWARERLDKKLDNSVKEAESVRQTIAQALDQLKQKNKTEALKSLAQAGKQLELVLDRSADKKLCRIDGHTEILDIDGNENSVKESAQNAKKLLGEGKLQEAREVLLPLASEIHIYVEAIPLDIYSKELKHATAEIEKDNLPAAEGILYDAIDAIVEEEEVIPLAPVKAEVLMSKAKTLYQEDNKKHHDAINKLVEQTEIALQLGKALGYEMEPAITGELGTLRKKLTSGTVDKEQFDKILSMLATLNTPVS